MLWFGLGAAVVLLLSYICYWIAFYNPESRHGEAVVTGGGLSPEEKARLGLLMEQMQDLAWEGVSIQSRDGLTLWGRYYEVEQGKPLLIQFHGYRGSGFRDFCGSRQIAERLGLNLLVVDQRAHGASQGKTMTFGILERYDCVDWAWYANRRFGPQTPIFLSGVSMGASTVLMASDLPLPLNVRGIIADCGYSAPREIICKILRDVRFPETLGYPLVVLGGLVFGGFCLWEGSALDSVKRSKVPILVFHGQRDRVVPWQMGRLLAESCAGEGRLALFPEAAHAGCYLSDPQRYEEITGQFLQFCLDRKSWKKP